MDPYKKAGVDLDEAKAFVQALAPLVRSTFRPEVLKGIGSFGGMFSVPADKYQNLVLVSSADGVGTKVRFAALTGVHENIGIDLVAMSVNDVVVHGAEPLFFLDYFATGRLKREVALEVMKGVIAGCRQAGCALIGGETAEMPTVVPQDLYDLAGFVVGAVERDRLIDGASIGIGNVIIGVASTGLHCAGYALIRQWLEDDQLLSLSDCPPELGGVSLQEALMKPSRIYARTVQNITRDFPVLGIAHIARGGLVENVPRILPPRCQAVIHRQSWQKPSIFQYLQRVGGLSEDDMYRIFNMGVGLVMVVPAAHAGDIIDRLSSLGEQCFRIGEIARRDERAPSIRWA